MLSVAIRCHQLKQCDNMVSVHPVSPPMINWLQSAKRRALNTHINCQLQLECKCLIAIKHKEKTPTHAGYWYTPSNPIFTLITPLVIYHKLPQDGTTFQPNYGIQGKATYWLIRRDWMSYWLLWSEGMFWRLSAFGKFYGLYCMLSIVSR